MRHYNGPSNEARRASTQMTQDQVDHVKKFGIHSKKTRKLLKGFKEENCHALICFY